MFCFIMYSESLMGAQQIVVLKVDFLHLLMTLFEFSIFLLSSKDIFFSLVSSELPCCFAVAHMDMRGTYVTNVCLMCIHKNCTTEPVPAGHLDFCFSGPACRFYLFASGPHGRLLRHRSMDTQVSCDER